ncbi:MAG TPA: DUF4013 domain-containing protein [Methanocorpusculum sp.]|nr:DUF4013 domain-containing protein [Methanocorpusculum sp.]
MEHADIIYGAYTYTKNAFFGLKQLPRWIVLFLYLAVPILGGLLVATVILQFLVQPFLVGLLVNDNYGFTQASISGLLQYIAIILGLACVIFVPLIQGYCYRIFKSDGPDLPEHNHLWKLFFNGWRVNAVILFYAIPIIVISLIYSLIFMYLFPNAGMYATLDVLKLDSILFVLTTFSFVTLEFITLIFVSLFAFVGLVHLARSGSLSEAIHLRGIAGIIRKIGWYDYILSLVIMSILFLLVTFVIITLAQFLAYNGVAIVVLLGVYFFVMIPIVVFFIKYLSQVYDTAFMVPESDDADFDEF